MRGAVGVNSTLALVAEMVPLKTPLNLNVPVRIDFSSLRVIVKEMGALWNTSGLLREAELKARMFGTTMSDVPSACLRGSSVKDRPPVPAPPALMLRVLGSQL